MSAVEVYRFPGTGEALRTGIATDGTPWIVGRDAALILGHSNPQKAIRDHVPAAHRRVNGSFTPPHLGIDLQAVMISEAGLYRLIMRSNTTMAEQFQEWVTADLLPTLRRTGRYEVARLDNPLDELERQTERTTLAIRIAREQSARAELAEGRVLELEPKAAQADAHRAADGLLAIADFANRVKAWAKAEHGVTVKHEDVWNFLGEIGLIVRGNTVRHNQPTAMAVERDFVRTKVTKYETNNHGERASSSSRLTPAGEGWAWDRAVRRIAEHGSLKPTQALART